LDWLLQPEKFPKVELDVLALNQHHEPESAEDALQTYSSILLPERIRRQIFAD
jgi:hypothetical protein